MQLEAPCCSGLAHLHGSMTTILAAQIMCSYDGVLRVSDDYILNDDGPRRYAGPPALNPLCSAAKS